MPIYPEQQIEQIIPTRKKRNPFTLLIWMGKALVLFFIVNFVLVLILGLAARLN